MLKKQKREKRKPKNVLSEYKSEDIAAAGNQDYDVDSVLMALGEVEENVKRKEKKKKSRKGKTDHKKRDHIGVEDDKEQEDSEEAEKATGSERVFGFNDTEEIASKMGCGLDVDVPSSEEGKAFACRTFTDHPRVKRYHLFMAAKKLRATVTDGQAVRCTTQGSPGQT